MRSVLYIALLLPSIAIGDAPPCCGDANLKHPIVYTSSPRDLRPIEHGDRSIYQAASDVAAINGAFEETDLEIKMPDGTIKTIYNCTGAPTICAAQEPRVSPDGTKIAYSLSYGDAIVEVGAKWINEVKYAKLMIYDVATGISTEIPNQSDNVINRMPDWISNTKLVYSSNAGNTYPTKDQSNCHRKYGFNNLPPNQYCTSQTYGYGLASRSMQIWSMNIDGTGQKNLTPHENMAIRPIVLKQPRNKGRIVFSSWQSQEDRGYYEPSNGMSTIANLYWLCTIDQNGADQTCIINGHHSGYIKNHGYLAPGVRGGQGVDEFLAFRSAAEDTQGRIYATSYYRGNHFGLGNVYRWTVTDFSVEGCSTASCQGPNSVLQPSTSPGSGHFVPKDLLSIAPFGVGQDVGQAIDAQGRLMGVMGYMASLKDGRMMATWGHGWCYNQPIEPQQTYGNAQMSCDRDIVELQTEQITDPFTQLKPLAADPNKNEWDAAEVVATAVPLQTLPLDESKGCYLDVVNMFNAELHPASANFNWDTWAPQVGSQGNAVKAYDPAYYASHIKTLNIYGLERWPFTFPNPEFGKSSTYHGYRDKWLMASAPINSDGSVRMQIPCNTPFQISGADAEGTVIAHDSMAHSLRLGETRTCHGCHDGHSVERSTAIGAPAVERFSQTLASKTNPPLQNRKNKVTFAEVSTILANRCAGCHTGFTDPDPAMLWSRVAADQCQQDWPWIERKSTQNGNFCFARPDFSALVSRHPRWSLLYWYCTNARQDGYRNEDFNNDRDFKGPHASGATPAECRKIAKWINLGAPL